MNKIAKKHTWLVTGGAGFIGSHIVERLVAEGQRVRILDNFCSGKMANLSFTHGTGGSSRVESQESRVKRSVLLATRDTRHATKHGFELIRGDIRDAKTCNDATKGVDYVLHEAALRSVPKSMSEPHEYNAVNIDGTVNMLEAALKNKVKRFVYASSSSVYGEAVKFPEKETDLSLLISPYALTKYADEFYARIFSVNYGLETVGLRYFNVFGERQSLDDEYAVVIPKFITCMLNDEQPPVHGTGKQSRDFTYVANVVEANIRSAVTPGLKCEVLNVALGRDHSVLDLVATINKILGKNIKPKHTPKRAGDVMKSLADVTRMRRKLGIKNPIGFEEGLRRTVRWFAERAGS